MSLDDLIKVKSFYQSYGFITNDLKHIFTKEELYINMMTENNSMSEAELS